MVTPHKNNTVITPNAMTFQGSYSLYGNNYYSGHTSHDNGRRLLGRFTVIP